MARMMTKLTPAGQAVGQSKVEGLPQQLTSSRHRGSCGISHQCWKQQMRTGRSCVVTRKTGMESLRAGAMKLHWPLGLERDKVSVVARQRSRR